MRKFALAFVCSVVAVWGQTVDVSSLDLSSLDKLASKASEVNKISLSREQLQTMLKMIPQDGDGKQEKAEKLQNLLQGLDSVQVRNFEFAKPGEFSDKDLDAVRAQVTKIKSCSAIVDSKEKDEHSQIFMCSQDGKPTGMAIISTEPSELSVVFIKGNLNVSDLGKLGGVMGMPHMELGPRPRADGK